MSLPNLWTTVLLDLDILRDRAVGSESGEDSEGEDLNEEIVGMTVEGDTGSIAREIAAAINDVCLCTEPVQ